MRGRKIHLPPKAIRPNGPLARPFKLAVVNLLQEAGVAISGVGVGRLTGSRRYQLIRQQILHAPGADYAVG